MHGLELSSPLPSTRSLHRRIQKPQNDGSLLILLQIRRHCEQVLTDLRQCSIAQRDSSHPRLPVIFRLAVFLGADGGFSLSFPVRQRAPREENAVVPLIRIWCSFAAMKAHWSKCDVYFGVGT